MKDMTDINQFIEQVCSREEGAQKSIAGMINAGDVISLIHSESEYDGSGSVSFLPLNRLNSQKERRACLDVIEPVVALGNFTSGPFVSRIETLLRDFYGANTAVATSSATDALQIALKSVGVGHGDEVIVPLNSFAATENAVFAVGARPVFANIDTSYNMTADEIWQLRTSRTRAVLPVCLYGSTQNMRDIYRVAKENDLSVIVDAAQCFGIGGLIHNSDLLVLSFNPFKNIGSFGKSGAVLTRDPELAKAARQFSYHGFKEGAKNFKVQDWGYNSRMDNLQAATLLVKMNYFESNAIKRSFLARRYLENLSHLDNNDLLLPVQRKDNTWHLFPVLLKNGNRDDLIAFAQKHRVEFDVYYPVLSHQGTNPYATSYPDKEQFRDSNAIHASLVHLPLHNHMSLEEQDRVTEVLNAYFCSTVMPGVPFPG